MKIRDEYPPFSGTDFWGLERLTDVAELASFLGERDPCRNRPLGKRRGPRLRPTAPRPGRTVEIARTVTERHDVAECVRRVCGSLRATTNVLTALSGLVRSRTVLMDCKWAPVVSSIVDLNRSIRNAAERESGRRYR